jgi:hypothetical protein
MSPWRSGHAVQAAAGVKIPLHDRGLGLVLMVAVRHLVGIKAKCNLLPVV